MSNLDETKEAFLVIAYPNFKKEDYRWINDFRSSHDMLFYKTVEPHFSLVFPTFKISEEDFIDEVEKRIKGILSFKFSIRCAMMNNDKLSEYYHVFLVPDEGNSNLIKIGKNSLK